MGSLLKGALIRYASHLPNPRVVPFQYNPEHISRTLSGGRSTTEPTENIRFELMLHVDGMEAITDDFEEKSGVYPLLAALEELLSQQAHSLPSAFPFIFGNNRPFSFVSLRWGQRELPVEVQRMDIREHLFNKALAPVHATVAVQLRVLTRAELAAVPTARDLLNEYRVLRRTNGSTLN